MEIASLTLFSASDDPDAADFQIFGTLRVNGTVLPVQAEETAAMIRSIMHKVLDTKDATLVTVPCRCGNHHPSGETR